MISATTQTITVSAYASRLASALSQIGGAVLEGEVQDPGRSRGGMLFFGLTDGDATLKCKVFPREVRGLEHEPRDGDLVRVVVDRPDFYAPYGQLTAVVSEVELAGVGRLLRRRRELMKRLEVEGLTDQGRWKPRPWLPNAVGVIAPSESKSLTDVKRALVERFPPVQIITCCARVQGLAAVADLVDALAHLDKDPRVEVIILARGGGSPEQLVAFDDERLCRAVFACSTPVISAVGHTDNIPTCNFVTWHAATPTSAPELAVPSAAEVRLELKRAGQLLDGLPGRIAVLADQLAGHGERIAAAPRLEERARCVDRAAEALERARERFFTVRSHGLDRARDTLATVPNRLPSPDALAAPVARIDAAARRLFNDRRRAVEELGVSLGPRMEAHLARRQDAIDERAAQVASGIRRELTDHERDFGRAARRITNEVRLAAERALATKRSEAEGLGERAAEGARRQLERAQSDARHAAEIVEALDPRRRGWVLPQDEEGRVRRLPEIKIGDRLTFLFDRGRLEAAAEKIEFQEDLK